MFEYVDGDGILQIWSESDRRTATEKLDIEIVSFVTMTDRGMYERRTLWESCAVLDDTQRWTLQLHHSVRQICRRAHFNDSKDLPPIRISGYGWEVYRKSINQSILFWKQQFSN